MNRVAEIQKKVQEVKAHFPPSHKPCLVHITKKRPISDIEAAYSLGVRDFGENRIDELKEKSDYFLSKGINDIRWHFIGHIQSNKINRLFKIPGLHALHSVDSLEHLKKLVERQEHLVSSQVLFFVEVNTSGEAEKSGVASYDELAAMANYYLDLKDSRLVWHGLMTMGKIRTDTFEADAHTCFAALAKMRDQLAHDFDLKNLKLSMGMSSDYKIALQEGADYLRLGSILYL